MIKLPDHRATQCQGIFLGGLNESCDMPIEAGSMFPYCAYHREKLQTGPRITVCDGAIVYDAAMRQTRVPCENETGSATQRLCPRCANLEAQEKARAKRELENRCPTCGQLTKGEGRTMSPNVPAARGFSPSRSRAPTTSKAPTASYGHGAPPWQTRDDDDS